jgi:hypothetical protein
LQKQRRSRHTDPQANVSKGRQVVPKVSTNHAVD